MSRDMIAAGDARTGQAPSAATEAIAPQTTMDAVTLYVRDIDAMVRFYTQVIALDVLSRDAQDGRPALVVLGRGATPLVALREARDLPPRQPRSAGLFHTALLFEDRAALARVVARVAAYAPELYTGSADHLVSEAFYLDDPEGNGIELYVDRPRDQWTWRDGRVQMDSLALDPNAFLTAHLDDPEQASAAPATVGHVHLQVGDIAQARSFYAGTLGFDVTADLGSALFVSAGGYHHHLAMNTWRSMGAGPRPVQLGLGEVSIVVPARDDVVALTDRLAHRGVPTADDGATLTFADPWRNEIRVAVA
ncbi:glyoxalase [Flavimobilis marinus]|uniref:Catechol 2,3-dioxygenase n=1 Tax=Flavimobilis marinus TaxID=285351 RepID=A0A1I2CDU7_9MICO|nr:VOC family protein [Flavimobilis marinus]GHG47843.1 glyoxalase [Flavimobilis marinus]SFE66372.1 catechol 2,3-dioxygenase [Flavimobilis marinus]